MTPDTTAALARALHAIHSWDTATEHSEAADILAALAAEGYVLLPNSLSALREQLATLVNLPVEVHPDHIEKADPATVRVPKAELEALREFLVLKPHGTVGPEKVPWFIHCGISHAQEQIPSCIVCRTLAALSTDET